MRTFLLILIFLVASFGYAMEYEAPAGQTSELFFKKDKEDEEEDEDDLFTIYRANIYKKELVLSQNPTKFQLVESRHDGSKMLLHVDPFNHTMKEERITVDDDEVLIFKSFREDKEDSQKKNEILLNRRNEIKTQVVFTNVVFKDANDDQKKAFLLNKEHLILYGKNDCFVRKIKRDISPNLKNGINHIIPFGDRSLVFFEPDKKTQKVGISNSTGKILMKLNFLTNLPYRGAVTIFKNNNFAVLDHDIKNSTYILYFGVNNFPMQQSRRTIINALYNDDDLAKVNGDIFSWALFKQLLKPRKIKNGNGRVERDIAKFKGRILYAEHKWISANFDNETWSRLIEKKKLFEPIPKYNKEKQVTSVEKIKALFKAVEDCNLAGIDELVEGGLILGECKNEQGQTPAEYARSQDQLVLSLALKNNNTWRLINKNQLKIECGKITKLNFLPVKPFDNKYFELHYAIPKQNLMLSLNPDGPFFVQSLPQRYDFLKLNFEKRYLIDTGERLSDTEKTITLFGKDSEFQDAIIKQYIFPRDNEKKIQRKIIFQDWHLVFYKKAFLGISDSQEKKLAKFEISQAINPDKEDIAFFKNGDFAILVHGDKNQIIYYGKNKCPVRDTCLSIVDAHKQDKPIPKKISWEAFKAFKSAEQFEFCKLEKSENNDFEKYFGSGMRNAHPWLGTNLFSLFSFAPFLDKNFWTCLIDQKKLLQPALIINFLENEETFENRELFTAIDACNIKQIDVIIKQSNKKGIRLDKIIFHKEISSRDSEKKYIKQTPSEYAHEKKYKSLKTALFDERIWNVINKKNLREQCMQERKPRKTKRQLNNYAKKMTVEESVKLGEACKKIVEAFHGGLGVLHDDLSVDAILGLLKGNDMQDWKLTIFNGTIFYQIQNEILQWDMDIWSRINMPSLFDFIKNIIPNQLWKNYLSAEEFSKWRDNTSPKGAEITEMEINNFFKAVDECDVDQIELSLQKGIDLTTIKNDEGLSPSQIALAKNQITFAFALEDNLHWYIVDKDKIKEECGVQ